MTNIIRQGDVLLVPVARLPEAAIEQKLAAPLVLAYGEVTGHAHQIKEHAKIRCWSAGAERFIRAIETTALTHEEHSPVLLEKGVTYKQIIQVEEKGPEVRRVAD